MPNRNNSIQQFVSLRAALEQERDSLQKRLREIEAALGSASSTSTLKALRGAAPAKTARRKTGGRRANNSVSLREAITSAISPAPLSVRDIVSAVQKSGYKFQSKNPVNSVGAYLYGKEGRKHFKRSNGKFSAK